MKIKRVRFQNYRIYKDVELDFGGSSYLVFRGKNFSGKTSLRQGISMCVTPTTDGLDPKGTGFQSKIKRGESKAEIELDIQTKNHLLRRTVTLSNTGRTQRSICLSDAQFNTSFFDKHLEKHRAALNVVLNIDAFVRLDEERQKNLLAALVLPASYAFDKKIMADTDKVLGTGVINFSLEPFAVIGLAYKKLYDEREIVNRQVREFVIPDVLPVPENVIDSKVLEDWLAEARSQRAQRMQERDTAMVKAGKEAVASARVKTKIQAIKADIEAQTERAAQVKAGMMPDDEVASLKKVAAGKEQLDLISKEKLGTERFIDDYLRQLGRLEEIPDAGSKCPTCDQIVDPEKLKTLAAILNNGLLKAKDENQLLFTKIKALGPVENALHLLDLHSQKVKQLSEINAAIAEKTAQLEAEEELPEETAFDFRPYDRSLAEIDAEVERLSGQLRPVIAAEERTKEIAIKQGQLATLKEKAALLDKLVKYFNKDGIKAKLLAEYIGGFEHKINEVMSAWGYNCALSIEPYSFDVTNARGDVNPVRELSGAEREMFSMAFQCAVSRTANIGLVVIDDVDKLLPELRTAMNKRLYEMIRNGYLEQVILLVADTSVQVPNIPGTAVFMVSDGTVTRLTGKDT